MKNMSLTETSFRPQPPPIVMAPINCTQTAGPSTKDEPLTNPEPQSPDATHQSEDPLPLPPLDEQVAQPEDKATKSE